MDTAPVGNSAQMSTAFPLPATVPQPITTASSRQIAGIISLFGALGTFPPGGPAGLYPTRVAEFLDGYNAGGGYYEQGGISAYAMAMVRYVSAGSKAAMDFVAIEPYDTTDQLPSWTEAEVQHGGLTFGYTDVNSNYVAMVSVEANQLQLVVQVGGVETVLAKRSLAGKAVLAYNTHYIIEGDCDGTYVTTTLRHADGTLIDTVTVANSSWKGGLVGPHIYPLRMRTYGIIVTAP